MKTKLILLLCCIACGVKAQTYNAAYVKALYAKYPTVKSDFCPACKLWVNPYYKSIADTQRHMPLVEYEYFTKENAALSDKLNIPRQAPKKGAPVKPGQMPYQSAFSGWSSVTGQPNESGVYVAANKIVKAKNPKDEIAKGHLQSWILNSFAVDAVILSDTYTFNAACEDQSQNIGTELNTEEFTRKLLAKNDVQIWGGTFGSQGTFTDGKITDTYPAYYWKIIDYTDNGTHMRYCYWLPNLITETQAMTPQRVVTFQQLVANLGFDPTKIFVGK